MNNIKITLEDLFNLPGAVLYNPDSYRNASSVSTDTRNIKNNSIFFALKGEKFDGHNFIYEAVKKGAIAVIINQNRLKDFGHLNCTVITVKNTIYSYGDLARIWRGKLRAKVIAITGSNGKTTTKEMISTLLGANHKVCRTLSNNNNHIGVPLTIFSANNSHDYLVLELGTNHFGEIAYTSAIANPDYSVITNIGDSHLEFLGDRKGVAKEKMALLDITVERNGKIFINIDDPYLKKTFQNYKNRITFGFTDTAKVQGKLLADSEKPVIRIAYGKKVFKAELPVYGLSNAKNFLIAAAIAFETGLTGEQIQQAAAEIKPVDKRLNVKKVNSFTLINDTYNANPESMKSAFELLYAVAKDRKKIVILGDMFELGDKGIEAHRDLLKKIKKNKIDEVYTIGKLMRILSEELKNTKIKNRHFNNRTMMNKFLVEEKFENSVVLVKGSRGMKMEEFVKILEGNKI